MRRGILLSFFCLVLFFRSFCQIVINEVCSSNQSGLQDNDGEYKDWVELYNSSSSSVSLKDYHLSDDPQQPSRWTFPDVRIPGGGYLTVYASGKDINKRIDHWEAAIMDNDQWKYVVPSSGLPAWTRFYYDDTSWPEGQGGIGFGDNDDKTVIGQDARSVFMRKGFALSDPSSVGAMLFYMDYDDGFIAYLNGVEIARANMNSATYNAYALKEHEAVMYQGKTPSAYYVPPSVFAPFLYSGINVLSVQVHQGISSQASSGLTARPFLFLGKTNASSSYRELPGWASDVPLQFIHAGFSLSSKGEHLILSDPSGTVVDEVSLPSMASDDSYGRVQGGKDWTYFDIPSPGAPNQKEVTFGGYIKEVPVLSLSSGFYNGTQSVTCLCNDPLSQVRFTTDGSKPTPSSSLYSAPVSIKATTVFRAGCFRPGFITEKFETNTYFINDQGVSLPVLSISTHPGNLMDADTGMYVRGLNASPQMPYWGANYWQEWEREVHMEYFDKGNNHRFEQDCGIQIFGGWSRTHPMKSLRLVADDKYGKGSFSYPLFSRMPDISEYDQINLRNGGNDFNWTYLRDQTNHIALGNSVETLGNKTNIDFSEYEPVVVFINGIYWGIHHMRERYNHGYFKTHHGISKGDYEMLEMDGDVIKKDNTHFREMTTFILNNDMTDPANYGKVKGMLDIENFTDYFIAQTYHTNWDWPHNNIKYWRPSGPNGKWRYLYYDTDFSLGLFQDVSFGNTPSSDELHRVIEDTRNVHSMIFKKLLANKEFRSYFVNRYADLINTIYKPSNYWNTFSRLKSQLQPEMARHFSRWPYNINNMNVWEYYCSLVRSWMESRTPYARMFIKNQFELKDTVSVTLQVQPAGAGVIRISTIIPKDYPWSGTYFNGMPVSITAIPNPGYTFTSWTCPLITGGNANLHALSLNITAPAVITANFASTTSVPRIAISEINYHSLSANGTGNWIELYNYGNAPADLSGWTFRDSKDYHSYAIPSGTVIKAGQRLVLVNDTAHFSAAYPEVKNKLGPFDFSFNNNGEVLRLFDQYDRLYLSLAYHDKAPWPPLADGFGTTLELKDPAGDINDGTNWFDGCKGGSPGAEYHPCPCLGVNLGPDRVLCAEGGAVTLSVGLSAHPNRTFRWYYNHELLAGVTSPALSLGAPGTYRLVTDSMGCVRSDEVKVLKDLSFTLGEDFTLCNPVTKVLDAGLGISEASYAWTRNGLPLAGAVADTLEVKTPGTYSLSAALKGCPSYTDEVKVGTATAIPLDGSRTGAGEVTLSVEGNGMYKWFSSPTGGSPAGEGNSFTTPPISSTRTYYVQNETYFSGIAGQKDNAAGGFYFNDYSSFKFRFDATKDFKLRAVSVYTNGSYTGVTIRILDAGNTVLFTRTVSLAGAGEHRVSLNWDIPAGIGYTMDGAGTTGMLLATVASGTFPYPYKLRDTNKEEILSITQEPYWAASYYPFFFKWEVTALMGTPCVRVPVIATVLEEETTAEITWEGALSLCEGSTLMLHANTGNGSYSHQWKRNGVDIPGAVYSSLTVSEAGNYSVANSKGTGSATSEEVAVTVVKMPAQPSAGEDQLVCSPSVALKASDPSPGTGTWSIVSGSGEIGSLNDPASEVTALAYGTTVFRWTVAAGACASSYDEVTVFRYHEPSVADAGSDLHLCSDHAALAAVSPVTGTGKWTQTEGTGEVLNDRDPGAEATGLSDGMHRFVWTVTNGTCPASSDTVLVDVYGNFTSDAGADVQVCNEVSHKLSAIAPVGASGRWSSTSPDVGFSDLSDPAAVVTGLLPGSNRLTWTVTDGHCISSDEVEVVVYELPSAADAGSDQYLTIPFTQLNANLPATGIGIWTQLVGGGFMGSETSQPTTVGSLAMGENIFRWTISNGICPPSTDEVRVVVGSAPGNVDISGEEEVVAGQIYTYSVDPLQDAAYEWSLPGDAELISGQGTHQVNVRFPGKSGGALALKVVTPFGAATDSLEVNVYNLISAGVSGDHYGFYPNPFSEEGNFRIQTAQSVPVSIKISNLNGMEICRKEAFTNELITLGGELPQGMYVVEASYGEAILKLRVVKMK